jgi:hypothetical protein
MFDCLAADRRSPPPDAMSVSEVTARVKEQLESLVLLVLAAALLWWIARQPIPARAAAGPRPQGL